MTAAPDRFRDPVPDTNAASKAVATLGFSGSSVRPIVISFSSKLDPNATFIPRIGAVELIAPRLRTLTFEPVVVELLTRAKRVKSVHIINELAPGNLPRALAGDPVGALISS